MNRSEERAAPERSPTAERRVSADALFYPAATLYALAVLPASVFALLGLVPAPPGIATAAGHAHEMLFGFALAVVAGNQLGAMPAAALAFFLLLWALARASWLAAPYSLPATAANALFPALLALRLGPRRLRSAKKLRNKALPAVLIAICAAAIGSAVPFEANRASQRLLFTAVLLFALLLLFMGGRIIAPAVAGQFYRQGADLQARVQPRIEAALILLMAAAIATSVAERFVWVALGAVCLFGAGALAAVRLLRWRLWALSGRPDLLCLVSGYGWLAVGLLVLGAVRIGAGALAAPLHLITVGSLGTLTFNVMATSTMRKARRDPSQSRLLVAGTLLIAAAALLRVASGFVAEFAAESLTASALCWSGAYALLTIILWQSRHRVFADEEDGTARR